MEALELATVNGARAGPGRSRRTCGCKATWFRSDAPARCRLRRSGRYLYSADGGDVDTVIVDGDVVVQYRKPVRADVAQAVAQMIEAKARVRGNISL